MPRLPEIRRIEEAIEKKIRTELEWALSYCELKIKYNLGSSKQLRLSWDKHWSARKKQVQDALDQMD
jgi:hypothetical protein